jgi:flagellar biogenesis protein FliO
MTLEPSLTWYVFRSFTALAVVLGLILLVAGLVRRYMPGLGQMQGGGLMPGRRQRLVQVVEVTALDRQHRVAVIQVEGRRLLVGFGGGQVSAVADLDADIPADSEPGSMESRLEAVP